MIYIFWCLHIILNVFSITKKIQLNSIIKVICKVNNLLLSKWEENKIIKHREELMRKNYIRYIQWW